VKATAKSATKLKPTDNASVLSAAKSESPGKRPAGEAIEVEATRPHKKLKTESCYDFADVDENWEELDGDLAEQARIALGGCSAVAIDKSAWIAKLTQLDVKNVKGAAALLEEGNTVPFVARYRKEKTGSMNEEDLRKVERSLQRAGQLETRRCRVAVALHRQEAMTDDLRASLLSATALEEVEDIWAPFKQKRKTRSEIALAAGLLPLAKLIKELGGKRFLEDASAVAAEFVITGDAKFHGPKEALIGARDILAEEHARLAEVKHKARHMLEPHARLTSRLKSKGGDEEGHFKTYHQFDGQMQRVKPYQFLAMQRGETKKALTLSFALDDRVMNAFTDNLWHLHKSVAFKAGRHPTWEGEWGLANVDALKRLILPSLEREWRRVLKDRAEDDAFDTYRRNIQAKLLSPPLRMHPEWGERAVDDGEFPVSSVLGIDPAYRTGCKLALVKATGQVLSINTVYPHPPIKGVVPPHQARTATSALREILSLGLASGADAAASFRLVCSIGNGTASRETEQWLRQELKSWGEHSDSAKYIGYAIVDEAGASVYSASPLAGKELPEMDCSIRGAVSIARRLIDPLAELVKIDPQSIGVGLYQHDVDQKRLTQELRAAVEDCVNAVGVDLNTASPSLLEHVSGLSGPVARAIVKQREEEGLFESRIAVRSVKGVGKKVYHQAAGFLRVYTSEEKLDATAIHPESYDAVRELQQRCGKKAKRLDEALSEAGSEGAFAASCGFSGVETLKDAVAALSGTAPDPRAASPPARVKSLVGSKTIGGAGNSHQALDAQEEGLTVDALQAGAYLQGVVRNVVAFGAFVDIGVGHDALLHSSCFNQNVQLRVNDRIEVWVVSATSTGGHSGKPKWRVGVTMKGPPGTPRRVFGDVVIH